MHFPYTYPYVKEFGEEVIGLGRPDLKPLGSIILYSKFTSSLPNVASKETR
jgi:hypothetical protein